jgi:hypothetical protein
MRSIAFLPSPRAPVPDRGLRRYADTWVVVRGGKVVLHATSYDERATKRGSGWFNDEDRIIHLAT